MKNFCLVKDGVKEIKRQATDIQKTLTNYLSNKGLLSYLLYKEFSKFNKKENKYLN